MPRFSVLAAVALVASGGAFAQQPMPAADANAPANMAVKSNDVTTTTTVAKGANSFTEVQARKRMTEAGFANVTHLRKDSEGLWKASATKGGRPVTVALDYKGNVTSN